MITLPYNVRRGMSAKSSMLSRNNTNMTFSLTLVEILKGYSQRLTNYYLIFTIYYYYLTMWHSSEAFLREVCRKHGINFQLYVEITNKVTYPLSPTMSNH